ncbi:hypothetical protein ACFQ88_08595 [Paenibacillus sp. NPDC056579]|uniref:hypothetical protein n=1 Tax=Paenibacillus sp. NPDC056579 TaxID=3345871 RepID=UPI0036CCEE50
MQRFKTAAGLLQVISLLLLAGSGMCAVSLPIAGAFPPPADLRMTGIEPLSASGGSTIVLQTEQNDVTGDGLADTITLIGSRHDADSLYYHRLTVRILRGGAESESALTSVMTEGGYDPRFLLADFNADKVNDLFVSTVSMDRTAASVSLYSLSSGLPVRLPLPSPLNVTGSLKDTYKLQLTIRDTMQSYMLDIQQHKARYNAAGFYRNGRLLKPKSIVAGSYSELMPMDVDNDGAFELHGIQSIGGISPDDTIASAFSLWKWRYHQWTLMKADITKAP